MAAVECTAPQPTFMVFLRRTSHGRNKPFRDKTVARRKNFACGVFFLNREYNNLTSIASIDFARSLKESLKSRSKTLGSATIPAIVLVANHSNIEEPKVGEHVRPCGAVQEEGSHKACNFHTQIQHHQRNCRPVANRGPGVEQESLYTA
jgi:hypothetical protein